MKTMWDYYKRPCVAMLSISSFHHLLVLGFHVSMSIMIAPQNGIKWLNSLIYVTLRMIFPLNYVLYCCNWLRTSKLKQISQLPPFLQFSKDVVNGNFQLVLKFFLYNKKIMYSSSHRSLILTKLSNITQIKI